MAGLVDAQEGKVAVLSHLAVLGAVHGERHVACGAELVGVGVVNRKGDGFAPEPIADVYGY